MLTSAASRLAALIRESESVVALTGAGISVPSGIPDFRSPGTGLWANVDPMKVAHIDVFRRDPERFWEFYGERFATVEPVFANLRHNKGLDRFTLRGRHKVDTQWKLFCLVHNIEKLAHHGYAQ